MVFFENVDILINNSGILADSASISSENNLKPIYSIGNKGTHNLSPAGPIKHTINFSYLLTVNQDPNFFIASGIKNNNNNPYTGVTIEVNSITGINCLLKSISYNARPNDVVRANAVYETYQDISGGFQETQAYSGQYLTDVAHGWATYFSSNESYFTNPIYDLSYSYDVDWSVRYSLGKKEPVQISYISSNEKIELDQENYTKIEFSGQNALGTILENTETGLDFFSLNIVGFSEYDTGVKPFTGSYNHLPLNLSGFKIYQSDVNAKLNDILSNKVSIIKFY